MTWTEPLTGWHLGYGPRKLRGEVRQVGRVFYWQVPGGRGGHTDSLAAAKLAVERRGMVTA